MAFRKEKFVFNSQTLKFEKAVVGWGTRLLRVIAFICASVVFSLVISSVIYRFLDSPKEKLLRNELTALKEEYAIMEKEVDELHDALESLRYRDGNVYRVIFEADPIPDEVWEAGSGGANKYRYLEKFDHADLMKNMHAKVDKLSRQAVLQSKSYDQIAGMVKNQQQMITSIPSIQPVANRDLTRVASGFGMRIDPVYKISKFHAGMDFTAAVGTEVYVTGNGRVETVNYSYGGYGNEIVINHGYGYKTRYAHLSRFKVRPGQVVKRGDLIGYVGNTGKSTGPHLHYEVIKNGTAVNPVYYYYGDLTDQQFAKMLEISSNPGQTFD